jgi:peptidoglycan hydrolase CwlO-like protein
MRRLLAAVLMASILLLFLSRTGATLPVFAEPVPEETRKLLEKSLSIVEIDREIARISGQKGETQNSIEQSENQLALQEIAIAVQREKAGRVLRSYYMGYKDFWLYSLLSSHSLSDLIRVWDIMDMIVQSDHQTMDHYNNDYKKLIKGYDQLKHNKDELAAVEQQLIAQRERIISLQKELDGALAASGDQQMLLRLMEELQVYWKNAGLYEVKQHFKALAEAMKKLPEYIKKTPGIIQTSGLKTKLTITDDQLNEFLRQENSRFDHFSFTFTKGLLTMEGNNSDIQVKIQGRYTVEEQPENAIRFHVDALIFNGLNLPDTTRADLEREFDLGFYPQKLIKFVKAQSVLLEDGKLIVQLKIG